MRNKQVEFNPYIYTLSKLSCFGYEISFFLIHNKVVIRTATGTAGSYVTGTVSWKNGCQNFSMFIVAENTGSVNICYLMLPDDDFKLHNQVVHHKRRNPLISGHRIKVKVNFGSLRGNATLCIALVIWKNDGFFA